MERIQRRTEQARSARTKDRPAGTPLRAGPRHRDRRMSRMRRRRPSPRDAERGLHQTAPSAEPPRTRRGPQGTIPLRCLLAPRCRAGAVCAATPIGPPATPLPPHNAERPAGGYPPRGPLAAHIEKRPPRARRPALPQPRAAVLSAKAGLTAGFGMGPGDPRLCGRARGGRSPAAHDMEPARSPHRGDPGGRMAGTGEDHASRSVLHRGCEELGLLVPLG